MTAQVEIPLFSKMKKLHPSRTEIFFKTEYVPRRDVGISGELGLGFGVKVCVRMSYRDSETEQHLPPSSSKNWGPAFMPMQAAIPTCGKIPLSLYPRNVDHPPRKVYPWRSGTVAASRGLTLKAALSQSLVCCRLFHCSVGHLYLCYQAVFYLILLKHKFKVHEHLANMQQRSD